MKKIMLNDILKLKDIENVKIRFNLMFGGNWNPVEIYQSGNQDILLSGHYSNYKGKKNYKCGQVTVGLIPIRTSNDLWLLFHVGRIKNELSDGSKPPYEYEIIEEYEKYFGRIIVKYKNKVQTVVRNAESVIDECEVMQILPERFDNDIFPGYDRVNITWEQMSRIIEKEAWRTALQNQKGVYLIVDTSTGKMYVGSAYGNDMILGRWKSYIKTGHGGNEELKKISFDNHIKKYFKYSILDIFKSSVDDQIIIDRESFWKEVLATREFGLNRN